MLINITDVIILCRCLGQKVLELCADHQTQIYTQAGAALVRKTVMNQTNECNCVQTSYLNVVSSDFLSTVNHM